jgi:hypothetical protein
MRFRIRTLMILLAVVPPVLAAGWWMVRLFPDTAVGIIAIGVAAVFPLVLIAARGANRSSGSLGLNRQAGRPF